MPDSTLINYPTPADFEQIKKYIRDFELDNRSLVKEQFLVAKQNSTIIGFGRIREYDHCSELCSLGVIEPERNKGIGKELTRHLIQKARQNLYLVCIIPDFFEPLNFKTVTTYPPELSDKLIYCTSELVVPETYVVMKYDAENALQA